MEYIRTPEGKDIKVIIPISEYKKIKKKIKVIEKLEKLEISPEDILDYALIKKTRGEETISLSDFLKNES
ncbi:MAG: hypothetical protein NTX22_01180 [Ignavibacteriales bacterium]|nr:hypothetical protein [Ignavibacteriales bacterium]